MSVNSPWKQTATADGGGREVLAAGSYPAVLVGLVDLGTHTETFENDGESKTKDVRKVQLVWEVTGEPLSSQPGKNHVLAKDYNVAFSPKAKLRKLVEAWRGKAFAEGEGFDISALLGKACLVTVSTGKSAKGNEFSKLEAVGPLPKGVKAEPAKIKPFATVVGEDTPPDWLPFVYGEKVADVIARSKEMRAMGRANGKAGGGVPAGAAADDGGDGDGDEEIPF